METEGLHKASEESQEDAGAPLQIATSDDSQEPSWSQVDTASNFANNDDSSNLEGEEQDYYRWSPSGTWWKDFLHFVGPGWFVCIAYVDPGNYQADIQAGATTRYQLLWTLWWTSLLSIYVQVLCVRLAIYGQVTLSEIQAMDNSRPMRVLNWAIAEFSTVITDLPEVIGIGIACNTFFGWPYYVGVLLSPLTTMVFLGLMGCGMRLLETIIVIFVGIMSISLWTEMARVGDSPNELFRGWVYGFVDVTSADLFSITGILGAVVMPHNLYLHTASCQSRRVVRNEAVVRQAVKWSSIEPVFPILISFFVNMAIVAIAAESVYGTPNAENVGLTDFCNYFRSLQGGCFLWAVALLAAGQSSAVTTTFTGQYVMDGFLNLRMKTWKRAMLTRLVAITPCVIVSVMFPNSLNQLVNVVNSALSVLLPFAFTPLVKYVSSEEYMGPFRPPRWEKYLLRTLAFAVYFVNAMALSAPGGGMFGFVFKEGGGGIKEGHMASFLCMVVVQVFYFWWNVNCMWTPIQARMLSVGEERRYKEGEFAAAGGLLT